MYLGLGVGNSPRENILRRIVCVQALLWEKVIIDGVQLRIFWVILRILVFCFKGSEKLLERELYKVESVVIKSLDSGIRLSSHATCHTTCMTLDMFLCLKFLLCKMG